MGSKTPFDEFEIEEIPSDLKHWRNLFDSRFLRFEALQGQPRVVTIAKAQWLKSSNKHESKRQLLLTLAEFEKPWAINITNSESIEVLYGNADPLSWVGKKITLYPTKTKFGREVVDCIRVRDAIPTEERPATRTQASAAQKAPIPEHLQKYVDKISAAPTVAQLIDAEDMLAEDHALDPADTARVMRWIDAKRQRLDGPG